MTFTTMMDMSDLKHRGMRGIGMARSASSDSSMLLPLAGDAATSPLSNVSGHKRPGVQRSFSLSARHRSYSPNSEGTSTFYKVVAGLLLIAVAAMGYVLIHSPESRDRMKHETNHENAAMSKLQQRVATFEQENLKLTRELQLAEQQARNLERTEGEREQVQQLDAKIKQLVQQKHTTHDSIQQYSMKQLMARFGPGPHRVEIKLEFDPHSNIAHDALGGDRIVIEMAPEADMPHSVYWFLEQVERGLYNGASFHRNAHHVIQAGPVSYFSTPPDAHLAQNFRQSGFSSVLFQEYSPNFPHTQYTLGYAGRPGGPDFYISVRDNSVIHGPGGQSAYNDPGEADPCFAKVIDGVEAVERMRRSAVKPGEYHRMEHFVGIRYMKRIIEEENQEEEHQQGSGEQHEINNEEGGVHVEQ
ncbi:hypothetical protein MPSEU_000846600 [Mayamaea pseudoterrestris]|nr:hypothetical protein MPSEU_000846600 [Mayamaea pseudoterrestris]